ncbi:MAG TPA: alpha/beta fold hydrolase [Acidimicrobiales bacterium]|nr:alpha/beta fold hydrolase [Acidimicrobiales bacterium]
MEIRVLGPIEVVDGGRVIPVPAAKERRLLACLVAHANQVVDVDRLIEALWGDRPPRSASKTLQTYVLHLRRFLGDRLVTRAPGYLLTIEPAAVDAIAFERAVSAGRLALLRGDVAEGAAELDRAVAAWRGRAYEGFDGVPYTAEAARLDELRMAAIEDSVEARLDIDPPSSLVAELEALVTVEPLRERLWALLMHALYRDGRQGDALRAYQRARRVLVAELGVEPGERLRLMERSVLDHDPRLDRSAPPPTSRYATTPDGLRIGYWTRGEGPPDVVLCGDWVFNLELLWEIPEIRPLLERLSRATRLVVVQRRGTGVSDRAEDAMLAPPEACVADVDAVLDELGCGRVALAGWGHGGQVALAYAARRPERVSSVAIVNGYARLSATEGYDAGHPDEVLDEFLAFMERIWGTDAPPVPILGPVAGMDPEVRARTGRLNRLIATPREAVGIQRAVHGFDVRAELPGVRAPVLVVHLEHSINGAANARWLADHLPRATYVELPGYFLPTAQEARTLGDTLVEFIRRPDVAR